MLPQVDGHRLAGGDRNAEISVDYPPQVYPVLLGKRPVKSPTMLERGHDFRVGSSLISQVGRHGIGWDRVGHDEAQQRNSHQHWRDEEKPPNDIPADIHVAAPVTLASVTPESTENGGS